MAAYPPGRVAAAADCTGFGCTFDATIDEQQLQRDSHRRSTAGRFVDLSLHYFQPVL